MPRTSYRTPEIPTLRQNYLNSLLVTTLTVVTTTVCSTLAGYALVFLRTPGQAIVTSLAAKADLVVRGLA